MDLEKIKALYLSRKIRWSKHCLERMAERDIKRCDIKNCILNGEIIEEYPNDYPNPSLLIFGYTLENKALHVVVGFDDNFVYLVTSYFPTTEKFESNLKTRRK